MEKLMRISITSEMAHACSILLATSDELSEESTAAEALKTRAGAFEKLVEGRRPPPLGFEGGEKKRQQQSDGDVIWFSVLK